MESLNLKKLLNWILDWKITFILNCGNDLLTELYKSFLKFNENVPKYGRKIENSLLGAVGTICLRTNNLSKNFLIHWLIILTGLLLHLKILFSSLLLYEIFPYCNKFWKTRIACELNQSSRYEK